MGWHMDKGRTLSAVRLASIRKTHQWGSLRGCGVVSPLDRAPPSPSTCRCVVVTQSAPALLRPQNSLIVTTGLKHMEHLRSGFIVSLLHNVCRWTAASVSRSEEALYIIDYSIPELNLHSESGNNQRTFVTMVHITVASILVCLVSVFLN